MKENLHSQNLSTGYKEVDKNLKGGINKGELVLIAGRPASGKTALALSIGLDVISKQNKKCLIFSTEMSAEQIICRLNCHFTNQPFLYAINNSNIHKDTEALAGKLFIDDTFMCRAGYIAEKIREQQKATGLDLVIVDYLQLLLPNKDFKSKNKENLTKARQEEIINIVSTLHKVSKETCVPILLLSQIGRHIKNRKEPHLELADLEMTMPNILKHIDKAVLIHHEIEQNFSHSALAQNMHIRDIKIETYKEIKEVAKQTINLKFNADTLFFLSSISLNTQAVSE